METLPVDFYLNNDTATIARNLLGKILIHETERGQVGGMIVETEAYLGQNDPASHSYRGKTPRNSCMFGPPGTGYIYISYGIHHCFNVVCQPHGVGEAVLIRALEPLMGLDIMAANRKGKPLEQLTNGPGKLCQALGIDLSLNGHDLTQPPLYLLPGKTPHAVGTSARIGISVGQELPLRFYVKGNRYVSRSPRN
ncbi:MAG: DNA-3-methyladenine glycosylase [Firmicutes bacterium]|nr:DNA-3-methyladenine glycosylase [Bacillota bacterium]